MIAYNAQFDLMFMQHQFLAFKELDVDYLDSLTVFREIEAYPHKLSDAINRFKLQGCINSHCAADDTAALIMVTEALSNHYQCCWIMLTVLVMFRNTESQKR